MAIRNDGSSSSSFVNYVRPETRSGPATPAEAAEDAAKTATPAPSWRAQAGGQVPSDAARDALAPARPGRLPQDLLNPRLDPNRGREQFARTMAHPEDGGSVPKFEARTMAFPEDGGSVPKPEVRTMAFPEDGGSVPKPEVRTMAFPEDGGSVPKPEVRTMAFPEDGGSVPKPELRTMAFPEDGGSVPKPELRTMAFPEDGGSVPKPEARTMAHPEDGGRIPSPGDQLIRTMAHPEDGGRIPSPGDQLTRTMAHPEDGGRIPSPGDQLTRTMAHPEDGGRVPKPEFLPPVQGNAEPLPAGVKGKPGALTTSGSPAESVSRSLNNELRPQPSLVPGAAPTGPAKQVARFVATPTGIDVQYRGTLDDAQKKQLEAAMKDPKLTSPLKDGMKVTYTSLDEVDAKAAADAVAVRTRIDAQLNHAPSMEQFKNAAQRLEDKLALAGPPGNPADETMLGLYKAAAGGAEGLRKHRDRFPPSIAAVMPPPHEAAERRVLQVLTNGGLEGLTKLVDSNKDDALIKRFGGGLLGVYNMER